MNMLNKKNAQRIPILPTTLLMVVLFLTSCSDDIQNLSSINEDEELQILMIEAGFDLDEVQFIDNYVLHDHDGVWLKESLLKDLRGISIVYPNDDSEYQEYVEQRQRGFSDQLFLNAVAKANVKDLKYFIKSSVYNDCGQPFVLAIEKAAKDWNKIYSIVNFQRTYNEIDADIIIGSDSDQTLPNVFRNLNNYVGLAQYPNQGRAGKYISLNDDSQYSFLPLDAIKGVMMHEFGHTLGFRHTNGNSGGAIPGSPEVDHLSVMNSAANSVFTVHDKKAIYTYYPGGKMEIPVILESFKMQDGRTKIQYKITKRLRSPYWLLIRTSNSTATNGKHWVKVATNNRGVGEVIVKLNKNRFRINGTNFRRDKFSAKSQWHVL